MLLSVRYSTGSGAQDSQTNPYSRDLKITECRHGHKNYKQFRLMFFWYRAKNAELWSQEKQDWGSGYHRALAGPRPNPCSSENLFMNGLLGSSIIWFSVTALMAPNPTDSYEIIWCDESINIFNMEMIDNGRYIQLTSMYCDEFPDHWLITRQKTAYFHKLWIINYTLKYYLRDWKITFPAKILLRTLKENELLIFFSSWRCNNR